MLLSRTLCVGKCRQKLVGFSKPPAFSSSSRKDLSQLVVQVDINCKSDRQLHKIDSLCIRPGAIATLHQRYPAYVVECEGSNIAMDEQIASNICVWREPQHFALAVQEPPGQPNRKKASRSISRHSK